MKLADQQERRFAHYLHTLRLGNDRENQERYIAYLARVRAHEGGKRFKSLLKIRLLPSL